MGRYKVERVVPLSPTEVFDAWVDPVRAPQWQEQLLGIFDIHPDMATPGATYRLDYGPGMKRQVTVLTSRRGEIYRVRSAGLGWNDESTVKFAGASGGTLVTYEVDLKMGWGPIGRVFERRLGIEGAENKLNAELDRFVEVSGRAIPDVQPGAYLGVDCGHRYRVVQLLADDGAVVHLRVLSGAVDKPPTSPIDVRPLAKPIEPLTVQPLAAPMKSVADVVTRGQQMLALDGGIGLEHMAMTRSSFADALPQPLAGAFDSIQGAPLAEIEAWRAADGPLGGRDQDFGVVPLVSYALGEERFGVAKVLKSEKLTVHLRTYSDGWGERPTAVNPWALRLDPMWAENPGLAHMAVSTFVYGSINPEYLRLVMVGDAEMEGYRLWKTSGGGKLGIRDVWNSGPPDDKTPQ